jgi:hypothetical protein
MISSVSHLDLRVRDRLFELRLHFLGGRSLHHAAGQRHRRTLRQSVRRVAACHLRRDASGVHDRVVRRILCDLLERRLVAGILCDRAHRGPDLAAQHRAGHAKVFAHHRIHLDRER